MKRFVLHYLEMLAVMLAGMVVLGSAFALAAAALGYAADELERDAPALVLGAMAASMVAPMVWWMDRRGHSGPATRAMALSMIAPSAMAIGVLAAGSADFDVLMGIQHVAMLPAMALAMLVYRREFTHRTEYR